MPELSDPVLTPLKVAAVSSKNLFGEIEANLANHEMWIKRAVNEGAKFIGFPECSLTGYVRESQHTLSLASRPVRRIADLAREHDVFIGVGLNERRGGKTFNTSAVFGPDGLVGAMRKVNCIRAESSFYTSGSKFPVIDIAGWKMGIAICADASFFEMFRIPFLRGAQVIFAPHANTLKAMGNSAAGWKRWRLPTWRRFLQDSPVYIVGCNNAGLFEQKLSRDEETAFCGGGMIMSPDGEMLNHVTGSTKRERMIVGTLDPKLLKPGPHCELLRADTLYGNKGGWTLGWD
ncbi:MAG: hypothetical protein O3B01_14685 [Planctomycetota bacterium]|nr:hypothetical protein [Planctomycetota bacterium]MDA1139819.1 hypothetical protein [Planctomycetota bacterium]